MIEGYFVGILSSLSAAGILVVVAKRSKRFNNYLFEVLGILELQLRYKNVLGRMLKRQRQLKLLDERLVDNSECPSMPEWTRLKRAILDNFNDVNDIVAEYGRCQDRFDHIVRLKTRLMPAIDDQVPLGRALEGGGNEDG